MEAYGPIGITDLYRFYLQSLLLDVFLLSDLQQVMVGMLEVVLFKDILPRGEYSSKLFSAIKISCVGIL